VGGGGRDKGKVGGRTVWESKIRPKARLRRFPPTMGAIETNPRMHHSSIRARMVRIRKRF
jgi:hypothetical protein